MKVTARSKEEMQDVFIQQVGIITRYWANLENISEQEKCEGVAFSIMNIFDGTCGGFPCAIDLVLKPHPDDKQYHIDNGDSYIEDGMVINDDIHLHEMLIRKDT